jgi:hypothetical protein
MADDIHDDTHDPTNQDLTIAYRSLSATIIQGVAASGALAYGAGHLAEGVAKLKDSFGHGSDTSADTQSQQSKDD